MTADELVGAWRLERFVVERAGRPPVEPFGPDAQGLVVYAADGWMSAVLSAGARAPLGAAGLETAAGADPAAKAAAFDSYLSYAGRWRLEGDEVAHTVELALVPEVVGQTLRRRVRRTPTGIELSYAAPTRGGAATWRLSWRRAEDTR
ncbi:MAG: lipocalin-like domain-containing protein [Myxococcales bacterium]|nr:lipocalin-like domain-containing protein [Myxococcales bacterium]